MALELLKTYETGIREYGTGKSGPLYDSTDEYGTGNSDCL